MSSQNFTVPRQQKEKEPVIITVWFTSLPFILHDYLHCFYYFTVIISSCLFAALINIK